MKLFVYSYFEKYTYLTRFYTKYILTHIYIPFNFFKDSKTIDKDKSYKIFVQAG